MATGAAPMRPKAGLIRDLLEGSFPELYPPPEPEPEPEPEEVEPAEPDAEAEAEASEDAPEPEAPADPDPEPEPEPEEAAGEAPPEEDVERPPTPELDAYQKRMAEIDARVRARAGPNLSDEPSVKPNVPKKGAFFSRRSSYAISPRSAGSLTPGPHRTAPHPLLRTVTPDHSGCFAPRAPGRGGDAPRHRGGGGGGGGAPRAGGCRRHVHGAPPSDRRAARGA